MLIANYLKSFGIDLYSGIPVEISTMTGIATIYIHTITITIFNEYSYILQTGFFENAKRNILGCDFLDNLQFGIREHYQYMLFKFEQ